MAPRKRNWSPYQPELRPRDTKRPFYWTLEEQRRAEKAISIRTEGITPCIHCGGQATTLLVATNRWVCAEGARLAWDDNEAFDAAVQQQREKYKNGTKETECAPEL